MKATKANVTLEYEDREEATFEVKGFDSYLDPAYGTIRLVLVLMSFLCLEG